MLEWLFGESKETKEKKEREVEVHKAEEAMLGAVHEGGAGLSHDRVELYDRKAHNLVARFPGKKLVQIDAMIAGEWAPLFEQHEGEEGSLAALRSLDAQVIQPAVHQARDQARQELQKAGKNEFDRFVSPNDPADPEMREGFREFFLSDISLRVTGADHHELAVLVYEGFLAPMFPEQVEEEAVVTHAEETAGPEAAEQQHQRKRKRDH